jgi:hypothetical protein
MDDWRKGWQHDQIACPFRLPADDIQAAVRYIETQFDQVARNSREIPGQAGRVAGHESQRTTTCRESSRIITDPVPPPGSGVVFGQPAFHLVDAEAGIAFREFKRRAGRCLPRSRQCESQRSQLNARLSETAVPPCFSAMM